MKHVVQIGALMLCIVGLATWLGLALSHHEDNICAAHGRVAVSLGGNLAWACKDPATGQLFDNR